VDHVTLIGSIPESPHRGAVERVLRHTVGALAGRWEIRIRHLPQTPWCLLRIKRTSDGFKCTVLLDLYAEPLELVAAGLIEALKHQGVASPSAASH
jgi:hypothetical protein